MSNKNHLAESNDFSKLDKTAYYMRCANVESNQKRFAFRSGLLVWLSLAIFIAVCLVGLSSAVVSPVLYSSNDLINNNTIRIYGNPYYNHSGDYYSFDGIEEYALISDSPNLRISDNITVSLWINLNSYDSGHIISKYEGASGKRNWDLQSNSNKIQLVMGNAAGTSGAFTATSVTNATPGNWYHVAFTFSTTEGVAKLFINGTNEVNGTKADLMNSTTAQNIYLAIQGAQFSQLNSSIDELRIYNSSLTSIQISQLYNQGRIQNTSLLNTNMVLYSSFDQMGETFVTGQDNLLVNFSYLYEAINDNQRLNKTENIFDLYSPLYINYANNNFSINNEVIRLHSDNQSYVFIDSYSSNVNISSSSIYSYNGGTFYSNVSEVNTYNRSYVLIRNARLNLLNSNISYLGFHGAPTQYGDTQFMGFTCKNCDNSFVKGSQFYYNMKAPLFLDASDNLLFENNIIFNNTGNGSTNTAGIALVDSNNGTIRNNLIYNIIKGTGWSPDDAAGIQLYRVTNSTVYGNTIFNAETGIASFLNSYDVNIHNNTIYDILGGGIKLESTNIRVNLTSNLIYSCGNTLKPGNFRPAIEIDVNGAIENKSSEISINNNTIYDCAKSISAMFTENLTIKNNNIINTSNFDIGYNGFPEDSLGVVYFNGTIGFLNITNLILINNTIGPPGNIKTFSLTNTDLTIRGQYTDYYSILNFGELSSAIYLYEVNNVLAFNTHGSIYGNTDISLNDGNLNITLPAGNSTCVFPNANLTEGVSRGSGECVFPLRLVRINDNEYHITSTLDRDVQGLPIEFPYVCSNLESIQYKSSDLSVDIEPAYTCANDRVTIASIAKVNPSTNSNVLLIKEKSSGGGGGSSGGNDDGDSLGGATIENGTLPFDKIVVQIKERWQIGEIQEIVIKTYNTNNELIEVNNVTATFYPNITHTVLRKGLGLYEAETEEINFTEGTEFVVDIKATKGTKVITQSFNARVVDENLFEQVTRDSANSVRRFLEAILTPIVNNPLISIGIFIGFITILVGAQYLISSKKNKPSSSIPFR